MRTLLLLLSFIISFSVKAQDIIIHNAKIFTADPANPYAKAIAIKGDKIVRVGEDAAILQLKKPTTIIIDAKGRTIIPGINDAHVHLSAGYPARNFILAEQPTQPTPWPMLRDSIQRLAAELPKGMLIRSTIHPDILEDVRVRRKTLDSLAPHHAVILSAWTGHGTILNSAAMQLIGITDRSVFKGGNMERDTDGNATGLLEEYAGYNVSAILSDKLPLASIVKHLRGFYNQALSLGITSHQVMATGISPSRFRQIFSTNDFGARNRVIAFPMTDANKLLLAEWKPLLKGRIHAKNEISGIKLILDGTPLERLAATGTPYADRPGELGRLNFSEAEVRDFLRFAMLNNQPVMVHAVGDSAVSTIVRAMRSLAPSSYWKNKRLRVEHGELAAISDVALNDLRDLNIVLVQNPTHLALPQVMAERFGMRTPYLQPMKSLLKKDIPLALGSDGPMNPYLNIMLAVMHPANPSEAITVEEAVTAYTYGSAYAEFKEKQKGCLAKGMLADLAMLSQDIFTIPLQQLPGTQAVWTLVGGKLVYGVFE